MKKIAIIISTKDEASVNIKDSLLNLNNFEKLDEKFSNHSIYEIESKNIRMYTTDIEPVLCENIDQEIDAELFIFATKHQSAAGIPTLSCHSPGNWTFAKLGGKDATVCIAPAEYLRASYLKLKEMANGGKHEVSLEQTHHGPYLEKPSFFIEIGSCQEDWNNKEFGDVIAKTIIDVIDNPPSKPARTAMVLGGGHYNLTSNKVLERTDIAVGHICAKFLLENLNDELFQDALKKHTENVDLVILDWKGLGSNKELIRNLLANANIESIRSQKLWNK